MYASRYIHHTQEFNIWCNLTVFLPVYQAFHLVSWKRIISEGLLWTLLLLHQRSTCLTLQSACLAIACNNKYLTINQRSTCHAQSIYVRMSTKFCNLILIYKSSIESHMIFLYILDIDSHCPYLLLFFSTKK